MSTVWLGLGTNIGDRLSHIERAAGRLGSRLKQISMAGIYETAPRDYFAQEDFLNTVIRAETDLRPLELLGFLHEIETEGGRVRSDTAPKKGPRTIDIDILLYGEESMTLIGEDGSSLIVPHKSMHERLFVLKPLLELDSDLADPRDGVLWRSKASQIGGQRVKLYQK